MINLKDLVCLRNRVTGEIKFFSGVGSATEFAKNDKDWSLKQ